MNMMKNNLKERHEPLSQLAMPENTPAREADLRERVTTIPAPSGVFSGWGPRA
jgi:hypothetical protein